ncbi:MAG: hypothetical protein Kow0096_22400 [Thiohalomonadaceae bacterium]
MDTLTAFLNGIGRIFAAMFGAAVDGSNSGDDCYGPTSHVALNDFEADQVADKKIDVW